MYSSKANVSIFLATIIVGVIALGCDGLPVMTHLHVEQPNVEFPLYRQCDPRWGSDSMGVPGPGERSTICGEGCAMSSLSMGMAGLGIHLPNENHNAVTPQSFNNFLKNHTLYTCAAGDCNNLVLNAVESFTNRLTFVAEGLPQSLDEVAAGIASTSYIYLAHVRNASHFVLLTGHKGGNTFFVNDPFYNVSTYDFDTFHDMIIYKVNDASSQPISRTPKSYLLFKQCNSSWGQDLMVTETICQVGCLMSSVSMGLRGSDIHLNGNVSNPQTLNYWLQHHGGYDSGNDLEEQVLNNILSGRVIWPSDGMHTSNDMDPYLIRSYMLQGRAVVLHVMDGHHFVLATGWNYVNSDIIYVNDPGFNRTQYSHSNDVVGYRIFDFERNWVE